MAVKWVFELPEAVQEELKADAVKALSGIEINGTIADELDIIMREKLVNVLSDADDVGIPYNKYAKYLFD